MMVVIIGVCVVLMVLGYIAYANSYDDVGFVVVPAIMLAVSIIVTIFLGISVTKLSVIDEKIAMYQEENTRIEEQVSIIVNDYLEHELNMVDAASIDSPIVLATLYPELKSNELVAHQIDIYVANNKTIKALKTQKINGSVCRWWLYFGK